MAKALAIYEYFAIPVNKPQDIKYRDEKLDILRSVVSEIVNVS